MAEVINTEKEQAVQEETKREPEPVSFAEEQTVYFVEDGTFEPEFRFPEKPEDFKGLIGVLNDF